MAINITCEACGHQANAPEKFVGRIVKCPKCKHSIEVSDSSSEGDLLSDDLLERAVRSEAHSQPVDPAKANVNDELGEGPLTGSGSTGHRRR